MKPRGGYLWLILIGIGVVLPFGLRWAAGEAAGRGSSYYFPQWRVGRPAYGEHQDRLASLTNIATGLPIVLSVLERSSGLGEQWNALNRHLPARLSDQLPKYLGPYTGEACEWLAQFADEPAVAQAVAERWPKWSEDVQEFWAIAQVDRLVNTRPEYLPLLQSAILSPNATLNYHAAKLLISYRPLSETNAQLLATWMTTRASVGSAGDFAARLADFGPLPRVLIGALNQWLKDPNSWRSVLGALVLARVAPEDFPAETLLPPRILALSSEYDTALLRQLARPAFRPVTASTWSLSFWSQLLVQPEGDGARPKLRKAAIADMLGQLGPAAAPTAPVLLPLLATTNRSLALAATRALVSLAPPSPEVALALSTQLTNEAIAGEILLWLTSGGTNALPAEAAVLDIAHDKTRYPVPFPTMDPILAHRYGLNIAGSAQFSGKTKNQLRKPSEVMVRPGKVEPQSLLAWWPGSPARYPTEVTDLLRPTPETDRHQPSTPQRPVSLDELAQHCLRQLHAIRGAAQ